MQPKPGTIGQCGCGRSPTGKCCGWHALTEKQYQEKQAEYDLLEYRSYAEDEWFSDNKNVGGKGEAI